MLAPQGGVLRLLIEFDDVSYRPLVAGGFLKARVALSVVDGASFGLGRGEVLGVVGESGAGKTSVARLALGLIRPSSGEVRYKGRNVATLGGAALREFRRSVHAVFQDPYASFNPRMRIRDIVAEPLLTSGMETRPAYGLARAQLEAVGIGPLALNRFPHEFSGGQRQRIAIARALSRDPEVIVLDEPVAALDVSIRGQIINLLADLRRGAAKVAYLLISHDLATTRHLSDRLIVMYAGRIVEVGSAEEICDHPAHPYSRLLVAAGRVHSGDQADRGAIVEAEPPSPSQPPPGCRFHPRCPYAMVGCSVVVPDLVPVGLRTVACHLFTPQLTGRDRDPLRSSTATYPYREPSQPRTQFSTEGDSE
jgi:oligopeptide/dipeptide ABC transporter ATP-binding protein